MPEFPFDPAYGFSRERLTAFRCPADPPADYEAFWRKTYGQCRAQESRSSRVVGDRVEGDFLVQQLEYATFGDTRVGAWLVQPRDISSISRALVLGHGYGGREAPDIAVADEHTVVLFPCAPGFHLSRDDTRIPPNDSRRHVVCGIESRDTYVLRRCVASLWTSASILLDRFPSVAGNLHFRGGSFGGGLGALAVPWEERFATAELGEPTFGCHPFRLRHECLGSGEAVRRMWMEHPGIEATLRYYDAAVAARFIRLPVLFDLSLADPSVPPPGQWAVANACGSPHCEIVTHCFGHVDFEYPEQVEEAASLRAARERLLVLQS